MVRKIYIPEEVKQNIASHLTTAIDRAVQGFESGFEDEDVLTGYLFGQMKIGPQSVVVNNQEIGGIWRWSIDFKKFGGRGKGATESVLGADGIIELHLSRNGKIEKKSLLFQSKLDWGKKDTSLYKQCTKMLNWLGATTVINYTETDFETYKVEDVFSHHGEKPLIKSSLKHTLSIEFLNCYIGDGDLHYDAFQKKLIWLDVNNKFVATKFNVNRRLKINVKAPDKFPYESIGIDQVISNDEISMHRLKNENSNFQIEDTWDTAEIKKKKNIISKIFHRDKHPSLEEMDKISLDEIMKGFNNQLDLQKEKIKMKS